jgi:hypothetical protein
MLSRFAKRFFQESVEKAEAWFVSRKTFASGRHG